MHWFIRLFKKKEIEENKEERVIDIKEPIYSFVECVRDNPKRFKVEINSEKIERWVTFEGANYTDFKLTDKVLGNVFRITRVAGMETSWWCFFNNYPDYLSKDEAKFLYNEIDKIYNAREQKFHEIKQIRAKRKADKEREQLMKDYCGDIE